MAVLKEDRTKICNFKKWVQRGLGEPRQEEQGLVDYRENSRPP